MSTLDHEIQARTEQFASELTDLIKRAALESVSQALAGEVSARGGRGGGSVARAALPRAATRARTKQTSGARGAKRSSDDLAPLSKALHREVKKKGGRGIEAIAEAMGVGTKELSLPVRKLLGEGKLRTRGERRATKYFAK